MRELTSVATTETEEAFLRKAQGKTADQVQQMVAGLARGDQPDAKPDPSRMTKRITFEVDVEAYAMWMRTRTAFDEERGERLSESEFVKTLCRRRTEPHSADEVTRPAVQTAVTTCRVCKESSIECAGQALPIDETTAERLLCDTDDIGDLESDDLTRVKPTIPAAIRRKVFHRDHFACVVPGCRSRRNLDVHHVIHREDGGDHSMSNVAVLCFACHQRHHEGHLMITGLAPDLQFVRRRDDDVETATATSPRWEWMDVDEPRMNAPI